MRIIFFAGKGGVAKTFGRKSSFIDHMTQSRIEILKGIRSLVDERIEDLTKKQSATGRTRISKVKSE